MTITDQTIVQQYVDVAAALKEAHDHVNRLLREHPEERERVTPIATALSEATVAAVRILLASPPQYA